MIQMQEVVARSQALLPALAGLGAEVDSAGIALLLDEWLEECEAMGLPREFCYRLLIGSLSVALGHHVERAEIDERLLKTMGDAL